MSIAFDSTGEWQISEVDASSRGMRLLSCDRLDGYVLNTHEMTSIERGGKPWLIARLDECTVMFPGEP